MNADGNRCASTELSIWGGNRSVLPESVMKYLLIASIIIGMGIGSYGVEKMSGSAAMELLFLQGSNGNHLCGGYRLGVGVPISSTEVLSLEYLDFQRWYFIYGPSEPETYKSIRLAKPIMVKIDYFRFKMTPGIDFISENVLSEKLTQRVGVSVDFDGEVRLGENTSFISGLNYVFVGNRPGIGYFIGGKWYLN